MTARPRIASLARRYASEQAASPPSRFRGVFFVSLAFATGYAACAVYPPQLRLLRILVPLSAPDSPHIDTPAGKAHVEAIEKQLLDLPIVKKMRAEGIYDESRPYRHYNPDKRKHSLLAGSLRGPGRLAVPPLVFSTKDDKECMILVHVGRDLCGHDGVIHGGLLASLLDEGVARPALLALPAKIGVTANLNVNYRAPCMADQFIVMRCGLVRQEGRKAWVEGRIESLDGELFSEATALYIQPKMAAFLSNSSVMEALGKRPAPN